MHATPTMDATHTLAATTAALIVEFGDVVPSPLIAATVRAASLPDRVDPVGLAWTAREDVAAIAAASLRASALGGATTLPCT